MLLWWCCCLPRGGVVSTRRCCGALTLSSWNCALSTWKMWRCCCAVVVLLLLCSHLELVELRALHVEDVALVRVGVGIIVGGERLDEHVHLPYEEAA